MSRVAYPRPRDEGGQILILTSAVIIAMLFLGAVVVDVGNWYIHRRHLQTQVDAAALAAIQNFTGCFLNQTGATTNISNTSLLYAGDLNRQPTGAPTPSLNPQVTPDTGNGTGVHVVLNSDDYWPTATADGWTAANPGGWATSDAQKPCTVKYIDVKATDDDVPGLLRLIPFRPDIHATARAEIRKGQGFVGVLPWAVPEVNPNAVVAIFYDESNGNVVGAQKLNKGQILNLNNTRSQRWAADLQVDVKAKTGVVIMTTQNANPSITGTTLNAICSQSGASCYAGNSTSSGLALVRALANGAAASAANPKLNAVSFGAGQCLNDTSAGYYVLNGDCNPDVTAKIDFGVVNPVIAPTYARVTLTGPGCPCTMAWRQSDDTWVLNSGAPTLTSGNGQHAYSMTWQTGGAGPGAVQVALMSPAGPLQSERVLAAATANGGTINIKKIVINDASPTPGKMATDFSYLLDGKNLTAFSPGSDSLHGVATETRNQNGAYNITEPADPAYTTTYSNSANGNANCNNLALNGGNTITCTITNDDKAPGSITVNKTVVNDDFGTKTATDFSFKVGTGAATSFTQVAGQPLKGQNTALVPAATPVDITEVPVPGYVSTSTAGCTNIVVQSGATAATPCTITNNDDDTGTLVVNKQVINDDLGSSTASAFSFKVDGGAAVGFIPNAGNPLQGANTLQLSVGSHTITEPVVAGYSGAPANCTITIVKGTPKSCTFTNNDTPAATVVVKKTVTNNNGGTATPASFTIEVRQGATLVSAFAGSSAGTTVKLAAGTYTIGETGGPAGYTLTYPNGGQDCSNAGSITVTSGGSYNCNLKNDDPVAGAVQSGTFDLVARPYAVDDASGPVEYLLLTDGSANRTYFYTSTGVRTLHVEVGLVPSLQAAVGPGDPPIPLRFGAGSRTQLLDCDHPNRNGDDEIQSGCFTGYATNPTGDCSAFGNGALPPQNYFNVPTPNCIAVATGDKTGPVTVGLDRRFGSTSAECGQHPNNWATYQSGNVIPDPDTDPRYVVLIVTDIDLFNGGGAGQVPIRKFAGFYVTGWSNASAQCKLANGNEAPPPGLTFDTQHPTIWGHFVNYVATTSNGDPSATPCDFSDAQICVGVLTR